MIVHEKSFLHAMISAKLKKLVHYFRQGGVYEVLLRLTASEYFPGWLLYFNEAQILRLDGLDSHAARHALSDYVYEQADRRAIDELLACSGATTQATRRKHFGEFFDRRARCHVMKHDGGIVAYCWTFEDKYVLTYDEYRRKNIVFALDNNEVFMGNVFVAQEHRHHGVFSWLFHQTLSRYPENTRFYSWAERTNDVSLQAHAHLGFAPLFRVLCVTICGITGYWMHAATENGWRHISREELERSGLDPPDGRDNHQD